MQTILDNILVFLERCTSLRTMKQIHTQVLANGLQKESYTSVKLLTFCSKTLGNIGYARKIFDASKSSANVYLWTAMVTAYSSHESEIVKEAIEIYRMMHQHGARPNHFTLSSVLKACSSVKAISEGEQIHAHSSKLGFSSSIYVLTTLLDMYAKFGFMQESIYLHRSMPDKTIVGSNSMIAGYVRAGDLEGARRIFDEMSHRDSISWTMMISGYASNGDMSAAKKVLDQIPEKEINSWNALIVGCSHSGEWDNCVKYFNEMRLGNIKPNTVTMATLMSACGQLGVLKVARQFHGILHKSSIEMNIYVVNSLVDMYAKCGSIQESYRVFAELSTKDAVTYNVMISGFASNGHGEDALNLFSEMLEKRGIKPDNVTFLAILNACSQIGDLELCQHYFNIMTSDHGVERSVDHYACMVDVFSRAGYVDKAYDLVMTMPFSPHAGVWGALLNACGANDNMEVAEVAAHELFRIEPENPGNYVILANIYARARLWDKAREVRRLMSEAGVAKMAGFSWIEGKERVHEFLNASHPPLERSCGVLDHLSL